MDLYHCVVELNELNRLRKMAAKWEEIRTAYHMFETWQQAGREFDAVAVLRDIIEED